MCSLLIMEFEKAEKDRLFTFTIITERISVELVNFVTGF